MIRKAANKSPSAATAPKSVQLSFSEVTSVDFIADPLVSKHAAPTGLGVGLSFKLHHNAARPELADELNLQEILSIPNFRKEKKLCEVCAERCGINKKELRQKICNGGLSKASPVEKEGKMEMIKKADAASLGDTPDVKPIRVSDDASEIENNKLDHQLVRTEISDAILVSEGENIMIIGAESIGANQPEQCEEEEKPGNAPDDKPIRIGVSADASENEDNKLIETESMQRRTEPEEEDIVEKTLKNNKNAEYFFGTKIKRKGIYLKEPFLYPCISGENVPKEDSTNKQAAFNARNEPKEKEMENVKLTKSQIKNKKSNDLIKKIENVKRELRSKLDPSNLYGKLSDFYSEAIPIVKVVAKEGVHFYSLECEDPVDIKNPAFDGVLGYINTKITHLIFHKIVNNDVNIVNKNYGTIKYVRFQVDDIQKMLQMAKQILHNFANDFYKCTILELNMVMDEEFTRNRLDRVFYNGLSEFHGTMADTKNDTGFWGVFDSNNKTLKLLAEFDREVAYPNNFVVQFMIEKKIIYLHK